jgi:peptide/nickel transport system permease protein
MTDVNTSPAPTVPRVPSRQGMPLVPLCAMLVIATIFALVAVAPVLGLNPYQQDLAAMLQPPSAANPFGTDMLGRDLLARVIWGGGPPILVGLLATLAAMVIGVTAGLWAGYRQGAADAFFGRLADIQMSIPGLILALLILALFGSNIFNLIVVIALETWPLHFRVVRSHVMATRNLSFVEAARLAGLRETGIVLRHIAPGTIPLLAVTGTANFSHAVLAEAGLSFLGIGVQPPAPDWGMMVAEGQTQLGDAWWMSIFPGLALVMVLLSVQIIGDWLADRFSVRGEGLR